MDQKPKILIDITTEKAPKLEYVKDNFKFKKPRAIDPIKSKRVKFAIKTLLAILIGFLCLESFGVYAIKKEFQKNKGPIIENLKNSKTAFENLKTADARKFLGEAENGISSIEQTSETYKFKDLIELFGSVLPKLSLFKSAFEKFKDVNKNLIELAINFESLKSNGIGWFFNKQNNLLIETLNKIKINLFEIESGIKFIKDSDIAAIKNENLGLNDIIKINKAENFLNSLITYLEEKRDKKIAVLFENPGELRPGGGFTGSYAEMTFNEDGVKDFKTLDIYDPDGQLTDKIIPPKEIQGLTDRLGARDANWFFDYKDSAMKTLEMLERSKIYQEHNITFDGAIALNINVLKTVLQATGEIKLDEYKKAINSENFLNILQKEVETGADKLKNEPKRIIKLAFPKIVDGLKNLNESQKNYLLNQLKSRLDKKDIIFYFKNIGLQAYIENLGIGGRIYEIPKNFNGDYVGLVSINTAGGKSDAVTGNNLKINSKLLADGTLDNFLTLEKDHHGKISDDPWYRATNKSIIKIFTPNDIKLGYLKGNNSIPNFPDTNYKDLKFSEDPDIKNLEESKLEMEGFKAINLKESGKNVIEFWMNTLLGETKKTELQYEPLYKIKITKPKTDFEFVFEKQSGLNISLDYLIEAPDGFIWKESMDKIFNKVITDPDGRVSIPLTLIPDPLAVQTQP